MFHFPGCPPAELWIHSAVTGHYPGRVPPFGNLRIDAYLRLPSAYRSLSRPSSAISALASTLRSCSLDLRLAIQIFDLNHSVGSRRLAFPSEIRSMPVHAVHSLLRLLRAINNFDCCLFVSSLCSFQGAPPAAPLRVAATRVGILRNRLR